MIVLPECGGYWIDGVQHDVPLNADGNPVLPSTCCGNYKLEADDTAKCYRRHFLGKVRIYFIEIQIRMIESCQGSVEFENLSAFSSKFFFVSFLGAF